MLQCNTFDKWLLETKYDLCMHFLCFYFCITIEIVFILFYKMFKITLLFIEK